ncbi:MAG: nucleoside monophosphate kinase [Candidatus Veblenbacteria bacterium]|nr:nucleoside monophosphate kinase [Candidatus Veblenbacteria bacterium]
MTGSRYIFLGPQGSGKGTQAQALAGFLGVPHISTGEIFRQMAAAGDPLGVKARDEYFSKGILVPDEVTNALVKQRLQQADAAGGFILDGYPRNLVQAEFLARLNTEVAAIYLTLSDEEAVKRITGRRSCSVCGTVYHVQFKPPVKPDVCDSDGAPLLQRVDDTEPLVRDRLVTFHKQTEPLLEFYRQRGQLIKVDGTPPIPEVTARLRKNLGV